MINQIYPDDYGMVKDLPILYGLSSKKKVKQWQVKVTANEPDENGIVTANYTTEHGYYGGKIQSNTKVIKKGKNIGKANETTPYEQALSEAQSNWKSQRDQNYELTHPDPKVIPRHILPMLANKYKPAKQNIKLPCFAQPKLNGVRCLNILKPRFDKPIFSSRNGKIYDTLSHLTAPQDESEILFRVLNTQFMPDGEIYKHGWTFQRIIRAVKEQKDYSPQLEFWMYDLATFEDHLQEDYDKRLEMISNICEATSLQFKLTPTVIIKTYDEIIEWHNKWVREGFEGIILRNMKGKYVYQYRSSNLLKYKEFEDKEFPIVGADQGTGLEEGCVVWICENEDGRQFRVRPKGTREIRRELFNDQKKYMGEPLTVRFQERSEDNVPIFPVGIAIRDYE